MNERVGVDTLTASRIAARLKATAASKEQKVNDQESGGSR